MLPAQVTVLQGSIRLLLLIRFSCMQRRREGFLGQLGLRVQVELVPACVGVAQLIRPVSLLLGAAHNSATAQVGIAVAVSFAGVGAVHGLVLVSPAVAPVLTHVVLRHSVLVALARQALFLGVRNRAEAMGEVLAARRRVLRLRADDVGGPSCRCQLLLATSVRF